MGYHEPCKICGKTNLGSHYRPEMCAVCEFTPEKKTFKNVMVSTGTVGITLYERLDIGDGGFHNGAMAHDGPFRHQDWDMEVTFTRKEKAFVPGYFRGSSLSLVQYYDYQPGHSWKRVNVTDANE